MAKGRSMQAVISLAGKVDPSLAKAIQSVEKQVGSLQKSLSKVGSAMATGLAAAGGAAATAAGALGSAALKSYASYEQLVGGVETLFKDSAGAVQQYAAQAYQTAGVSANTYMEQATAFSASLIHSLGGDTQAAASYADLAIRDMSDNANKMGTDIESIQQTYQSLMRGNYAMLDNLKLGYGGTKAELERLVADASELTGKALDPAKFSDVIEAIHAAQDNLGITGTTALEAATTIEGSVNTMKSAWDNWLAGLGTEGADMGALTDQLVESIGNVANNVGPAVQRIGSSIVRALPGALSGAASVLAPVLAETLAGAWSLAGEALGSIGIKLPDMDASSFMGVFQQISDTISGLVNGPVGQAVANFANSVIPPLISALSGLLPFLSAIATAILPPIVNFLTPIISLAMQIISAILPPLTSLIQFLTPVIQFLVSAVLALTPVVSGALGVFNAFMGPLRQIGQVLVPALQSGFNALRGPIESVIGFMSSLWGAIQPVVSILGQLVSFVSQAASGLANLAGGIIGGIGSFLGFARGGFTTGPYVAGEDPRYPNEAVISFNPAYRAQNLRYWQMAGHMLGATSVASAPVTAAASSGGTVIDLSGITFAPNVEVRGNADKEDIVEAIRQCEGEFLDFVTGALARRAEAAYD